MDEKEILAAINTGSAGVGSKLETQLAEFNESAKKILVPKPEDIQSAAEVKAEDKAQLEQLGGITKLEVWDIPLGQALVGGFTAVVASELIDGFLAAQSNMIKGVVKLVGAGVAVKWGSRLLGSTGAKAVAILLAYDGLRMIIPMDEWANRLATGVSGVFPGQGLAGRAGMKDIRNRPNAGGLPAGGDGRVVRDYYAGLLGVGGRR